MTEATILVVDDEQGITALCQRVLGKAGYQVYAVTSPVEGVKILEREAIDLLLVDIRMPEMDGFTLMGLARRRHPELAVVIMTGYGTVETAVEALRRGADGLILKPFAETAELLQGVQHALLESRRKRDSSRLQALRPLFDVSGLLFAETDPDRLQNLLLDAVCGHLHCEHAGLYHLSPDESSLQLAAARGMPFPGLVGDLETNLLGQAAIYGMPVRINAAGPGDLAQRTALVEQGYSSVVCAPVIMKDSTRVLMAARSSGEPALSEADLEMLVVLGHQAAVALENARLYEELRSYVRQVEESQRMLMQAEKMATVGRMTASIAHEINNPLQSVRNCLHLANRTELPAATRQEYLLLAQEELERLMNTVQRMLEYYRPGAVNKKALDVNELIRRVHKLMEAEARKHQVVIQMKLAARLGQYMGVADQIQQVILNLMLNAIEAMPEGGQIQVETRQRKKGIEIIIEDSGPGISAIERDKIFEPFVSTKEKGTGLGLTVSYGIITAHGGTLELVPDRGKGACFRIFLPIAGEPTKAER